MTTPYHTDEHVRLYHGDCIEVMRQLPDASVDAVVTDPPYGLEFMGKEWDAPWKGGGDVETVVEGTDVSHPFRDNSQRVRYGMGDMAGFQSWCEIWATEALRVLKPGGHLLAFGGTRTWHRLACAIEDAGFEVRDSIAWMYGSGFPKSLDVSKAIDKAAGAEREVVGDKLDRPGYHLSGHDSGTGALGHGISSTTPETRLAAATITTPATPAAQQWQGWGTALKPAFEPIVVARKPLIGTVAANVLAHGTGALNVDGCRVGTEERHNPSASTNGTSAPVLTTGDETEGRPMTGRWPANVILDESQAEALDRMSGTLTSGVLAAHHERAPKDAGILGAYGSADGERGYGDTGGASRFFYTAKADATERPRVDGVAHPTVKPLDLMRYLVRLVTPRGGVVLEPFAGSGTTAEACIVEGFGCIAIEREPSYLPLILQRISKPIEVTLL